MAGLNQKSMRERAEEGFKREPELNEFVPEVGKTYLIRPLPRDFDEYHSAGGAEDFVFVYRYHFKYVKPDGVKLYNINCPKTSGMDKPCTICREGQELYSSPHEEDKKLASQFFRKERALINLIDLTDEKSVAKGVQWYRAPIKKVYEEIRKLVITPAWTINGKDILDLEHGRNWTLKVISSKESGTGFQDYEVTVAPEAFDIRPYLVGDWKERLAELVLHTPRITDEDIKKALAVKDKPAPGAAPPPPKDSVAAPAPPPAPSGAGAAAGNSADKESDLKTPPPPPSPAQAPPAQAPPAQAPPAPAAKTAVDEPDGKQPVCFGKKYAPRSPECVACKTNTPKVLQACRKKYLEA